MDRIKSDKEKDEKKQGGLEAHFRSQEIVKSCMHINVRVHVAYLSHGSEMLSKLYSVWNRKTGLIPYIMWSYMESSAVL